MALDGVTEVTAKDHHGKNGPPIGDFAAITVGDDPLLERLREVFGGARCDIAEGLVGRRAVPRRRWQTRAP